MKTLRIISIVCCLFLATLMTSCHDHFKVYFASAHQMSQHQVMVKDQFDKEPREAEVTSIKFFANPVRKNNIPIRDPNAHLTWYVIDQQGPHLKRRVKFNNQFDTQEWVIGRPVFLLVPTEKIEPNSVFPKKLDHYKAYEVLSYDSLNIKVTLEDQFDRPSPLQQTTIVKRPMYFCCPTLKNNEHIKDGKNHLACYLIETIKEDSLDLKVTINNQFGKKNLDVKRVHMLCVPTRKLDVEELGKVE